MNSNEILIKGSTERRQLALEVIEAALRLARSEQADAYRLLVPGTDPPIYVAFGELKYIAYAAKDD